MEIWWRGLGENKSLIFLASTLFEVATKSRKIKLNIFIKNVDENIFFVKKFK